MKSFLYYSLTVFAAVLTGCAILHPPPSAVQRRDGWYWYDVPCSSWTAPARVVANGVVGRTDTVLALLSGQVPNWNRGDYNGGYPVMVVAQPDPDAAHWRMAETDAQGNYRLYVPAGTYRVEFMGMGLGPFAVEQLALQAGQEHRLEVLLHVQVSNAGSCSFKSKRRLSPKLLSRVLARREARWIRREQAKADSTYAARAPKPASARLRTTSSRSGL